MTEVTRAATLMALIVRVGVDLAKNVIQVHAVDAAGRRVVARAIKREAFLAWCAQLPAGCLVAMEACSGAHAWGRRLRLMGLDVRLIAANFVTPYRMEGKGGKNDMTDAEAGHGQSGGLPVPAEGPGHMARRALQGAAICEAASRPSMRFVPIKTAEQQGVLVLHRLREGLKEERTGCINRIRGAMAEFDLVFGKSPKVLRAALPEALENASNELTGLARLALQRAVERWRQLDDDMRWCDQRIGEHVRNNAAARRAARITGIGELGASALTASVGDFSQFKNGAQLGAWLGLVPRQNSSGGKTSLGRITKRGDDYLRTLLIQGAKSAVMSAPKRSDPTSLWLQALRERVGWQKACVAMANKNARILWAVMTREQPFEPSHVSEKPAAKCPKPASPVPTPVPVPVPASCAA